MTGRHWREELEEVVPVSQSELESIHRKPDIGSLTERLRAATGAYSEADTDTEENYEEALRQCELAFALLEEPTAYPRYIYTMFQKARQSAQALPDFPDILQAHLEVGMALTLVNEEYRVDSGLSTLRSSHTIETHLESALAILRVHAGSAESDVTADALFILSHCKLRGTKPNWKKAIPPLREAVQRLNTPEHRLKQAQYKTILAAYLHAQPQPDWKGAETMVLEAIKIFESENKIEALVWSLRQIAWIYQAMPEPRLQAATLAYEEALKHLTQPSARAQRADTLSRLADCLNENAPGKETVDWKRLEEVMREAVDLWRVLFEENTPKLKTKRRSARSEDSMIIWPEETRNLVFGLLDLASLLEVVPTPQWSEAAQLYQEAREATPKIASVVRGFVAYQRALCLEHHAQPDWNGAIASSRQAVADFRTANSRPNLLAALQQLAFLVGQKQQEERKVLNERLGYYREIVSLSEELLRDAQLSAAEKRAQRVGLATALFNLAHSLHDLYFDEKIKGNERWQEAHDAAWKSAELFASLGDKNGLADAVRLTFRLLVSFPERATNAHVQAARRVLRNLPGSQFPEARADLLHHLSFVLHTEPRRRWKDACKYSVEAVQLLRERRQKLRDVGASNKDIGADELAETVGQLGAVYLTRPRPDRHKAAICFREAIELMDQPGDEWRRAETSHLLLLALFFEAVKQGGETGAALWKEIITCSEALIAIWQNYNTVESKHHLANTLSILGLAYQKCVPPDYERATTVLLRAVELPVEGVDRARNFLMLAHCESKKPIPELTRCLRYAQEAVDIAEGLLGSDNLQESSGLLDQARKMKTSLLKKIEKNAVQL